jgi:hypothetical protein
LPENDVLFFIRRRSGSFSTGLHAAVNSGIIPIFLSHTPGFLSVAGMGFLEFLSHSFGLKLPLGSFYTNELPYILFCLYFW